MTSEPAKKIALAVLTTDADQPSSEVAIDSELAEVREVLEGIITCVFDEGAGSVMHWCDPEDTCNDACQRARSLYDKLRIDK